MSNQQATDIELGWLAGIIDGEGWIGFAVCRDKRGGATSQRMRWSARVEVRVNNCDPAIVERCAAIFKLLGVNPYVRGGRASSTRRMVYECACKHMTGVEKILLPIREHLTGIKKQRAEYMLRFIVLRRENPGHPNPAYEMNSRGRKGPRSLRPYTEEELQLIEACRAIQSAGASETTRATRDTALKAVRDCAAWEWATGTLPPEMI